MIKKLTIIGRLGQDPVYELTEKHADKCSLNVAIKSRDYKKNEHTNWVSATVWGTQAKNARDWLKKGNKVLLVGDLDIIPNEGKPDYLNLNVDKFVNLTDKNIDVASKIESKPLELPAEKPDNKEVPF